MGGVKFVSLPHNICFKFKSWFFYLLSSIFRKEKSGDYKEK